MTAVAKFTSETLGRIDEPEWHVDWAVDWGLSADPFWLRITLVEQAQDQPYSALTEITIEGNNEATQRYRSFEKEGLGWSSARQSSRCCSKEQRAATPAYSSKMSARRR